MSRHCTIPTSTKRRGTGFGPATRHGSSAVTERRSTSYYSRGAFVLKRKRSLTEAGSRLEIVEAYDSTEAVEYEPLATLRPDQQTAVDALVAHELGVLVAPPGAGKTVIACALIALHRVPTLVIVDRQPLIEQWRDRLTTYLGLDEKRVGQIGPKRKASGVVDLAMVQSLPAETTSRR